MKGQVNKYYDRVFKIVFSRKKKILMCARHAIYLGSESLLWAYKD